MDKNKNFIALLSLCPLGLTNDPSPGQCARFIDINKNGFCDYSQTISGTLTTNYHLFPLFFILSVFYGITILLAHKKLLSFATHQKIWNFFLLITFLVSGFFGIFLVMKINYGWQSTISNLLFWHVEAGIIMTIISFFHILWHWKYFKNYLKK